MITLRKGNIFNSNCQTLVNAVNCEGVMGKGIALVYQCRYPDMFEKYAKFCKTGDITIGKLYLYKPIDQSEQWVLNFPTKLSWRNPSRMDYLRAGLEKFCLTYQQKQISSIAFPMLGTDNGGLNYTDVKALMMDYLSKCDNVNIEIWEYDPSVPDDLFLEFRNAWLSNYELINDIIIGQSIGLKADKIKLISSVLESGNVNSMIDLIKTKSIGIKTMQKAFEIAKILRTNHFTKETLFC